MSEGTNNLKTKFDGMVLTIYLEGKINKETIPSLEKNIFTAISSHPKTLPKFDAEGLKEISSEGLHFLKKIKDTIGLRLRIQNVSQEIYDIFEASGFTELFNIKKVFRTMNVEGMECVGTGITCKVLKISDDKIIKLYNPNVNYDLIIEKEHDSSRAAFVAGVSTPITYDIVKVGECCGTIYEYIDAKDFSIVIANDKEHLGEYIRAYAKAVKKNHGIKLNPEKTISVKKNSLDALPLLEGEGKLLNKEEKEKIQKIYENIPDSDTFVHGDCYPGNAKYKDGKIIFIDLAECGRGHPIFDLVSMHNFYNIRGKDPEKRKSTPGLKEFTDEEIKKIYDIFLKEYLGTEDKNLIEKAYKQIEAVACSRLIFAEIAMPGAIPRQILEIFKGIALSHYDSGLEPICF